QDPSDYSTQRLCADLAALLDLLSVQRAVVIGHDWGAFTAARFALWHPERLLSLILLSVPYTPPSRTYMSIEDVVQRVPNLAYQAYFANPASTAPIENDLHNFLSIVFRTQEDQEKPAASRGFLLKWFRDTANTQEEPSVLNDKEFQIYLDVLSKGGMNGPLNYYRTSKHRHEEEE
ncbi:Epoxide hydrolase 2, partial [Termitomyces sp. T112]